MSSTVFLPAPPLALLLREGAQTLPTTRRHWPRGDARRLSSAHFACDEILSGSVAVVSLEAHGVDPAHVVVAPRNAGFLVDLLPERGVMGDRIVLGLRIYRRIGTPSSHCVVRFGVDETWVAATVDVHHH